MYLILPWLEGCALRHQEAPYRLVLFVLFQQKNDLEVRSFPENCENLVDLRKAFGLSFSGILFRFSSWGFFFESFSGILFRFF